MFGAPSFSPSGLSKAAPFNRGSRAIAIALSQLLLAACAAGNATSDLSHPGDHSGVITVAGVKRTFWLHIPPTYDGKKQTPVVLVFHGRLGTGKGMAKLTNFSGVADRHRFIVVYPDGIARSWNSGSGAGKAEAQQVDDVGFVSALIDFLSKQLNVDKRRIYATGLSNGGMFVQRLACELADRLAAVASAAGPMPPQVDKDCHPARPLAVLEIHGTADPYVPLIGGNTAGGGEVLSVSATVAAWVKRNSCTTEPKVTLIGGRVTCKTYSPCQANAEVVECLIEDGGHTWPGGDERYQPAPLFGKTNHDLQATEFTWTFFDQHPMKR